MGLTMIATAHRPIAAAGAALLGAGVIAAMPGIAPSAPAIPHLDAPQIALQASVLDIFKFPSIRQIAANQVEVLAIEAQGLADAGQGAVQSVVQLPGALVTATRQVLTGNALDALTTLEDWSRTSVQATFVPVIAARINVGQIDLAIQSALLPAWPLALVSVADGLFGAGDTIARGLIAAGQELVAAVLSFNISDIVQAVVGGIQTIATSIGAGVQTAVDGIVGAQNLLADALAARPAPLNPGASVPALAKALRSTPAAAAAGRVAAKAAAAVADQERGATATKTARTRIAPGAASRHAPAKAAASVADNAGSEDSTSPSPKRAARHSG